MPAPVALIHGLFGWGFDSPLGNRLSSYWPTSAFSGWSGDVVAVDVGPISSLHDRACEAFYQLYGGTVDYGEEHACVSRHERFAPSLSRDTPLLKQWDEEHPIHLIGHSYGGTTALMLYQMLCDDFFQVGSSSAWVISITAIGSPLSGATLPYAMGISHEDLTIPQFTVSHLVGTLCGTMWKLQMAFPSFAWLYNFRSLHWREQTSWRSVVTIDHPYVHTWDNSFHAMVPLVSLKRNAELRDMDRVFLFSGVLGKWPKMETDEQHHLPPPRKPDFELVSTPLVLLFLIGRVVYRFLQAVITAGPGAAMCGPSLVLNGFLLRNHSGLSTSLFPGYRQRDWVNNDGVVNVASQLFAARSGEELSVELDAIRRDDEEKEADEAAEAAAAEATPPAVAGEVPGDRVRSVVAGTEVEAGEEITGLHAIPGNPGAKNSRTPDQEVRSAPPPPPTSNSYLPKGGGRRRTVDLVPMLARWGRQEQQQQQQQSQKQQFHGEGGGGGANSTRPSTSERICFDDMEGGGGEDEEKELKRGCWHFWRLGGARSGVDHISFTAMDPKAAEHYSKLYLALSQADALAARKGGTSEGREEGRCRGLP